MIGGEPDWEHFARRMDEDPVRHWSPMSRCEGVAGSRLRLKSTPEEARTAVDRVAQTNGFELVPIGAAEAEIALGAFQRYGKGRHPARLDMGDCFADACAKTNGAKLLYKGRDFALTDLA